MKLNDGKKRTLFSFLYMYIFNNFQINFLTNRLFALLDSVCTTHTLYGIFYKDSVHFTTTSLVCIAHIPPLPPVGYYYYTPNSKSLERAWSRGIVDRTKECSFVLSTIPRLHARSTLLELGVWLTNIYILYTW